MFFLIQEGVERFGHRVLSFCLMNNHIHLLIQVAETPLSKIMQNLSFRYTRWVNGRHKRIGHLFQGRYKALLVDKDSYLLELVRYIHLNPVRAGLTKNPGDYEWSGHRAYIGEEDITWLSCDIALGQFGDDIKIARERYIQFVMDGLGETYRPEFHQGGEDSRLLGKDDFLQQVMVLADEKITKKVPLEEILSLVSTEYQVSVSDLCSPSRHRSLTEPRGVVIYLASELGQYTLVELAKHLQRDPSALSLQLKKVRKKVMKEKQFLAKIDAIKSNLSCNNSITHA